MYYETSAVTDDGDIRIRSMFEELARRAPADLVDEPETLPIESVPQPNLRVLTSFALNKAIRVVICGHVICGSGPGRHSMYVLCCNIRYLYAPLLEQSGAPRLAYHRYSDFARLRDELRAQGLSDSDLLLAMRGHPFPPKAYFSLSSGVIAERIAGLAKFAEAVLTLADARMLDARSIDLVESFFFAANDAHNTAAPTRAPTATTAATTATGIATTT